jgi:hypothetical protein
MRLTIKLLFSTPRTAVNYRMARGWFWEDIVELGYVSDHRLLVWFGGIDI